MATLRNLARMKAALLLLALLCTSLFSHAAATRFDEFTKKFARTPDQAEVIASTFLGSSGTEWLAAGGFQPDGTIVVAGVSLGPEFNLGVKATVLGTDSPMQPPTRRTKTDMRGRPELDKNGQPKVEVLGWNHPNATAFIARLAPDLKTIKSVTRLAWRAGGVTDAVVDEQGNIFLCGPATEAMAGISDNLKEFVNGAITPTSPRMRIGPAAVYLAKFSPDGSKAIWVRTIKGAVVAPTLTLDKSGKLLLQSYDRRTFDSDGNQISVTAIPDAAEGHIAANPLDGTWARGGDRHWPTGREPYRDPTLNIHKADGTLLYELYNWDGPLVGLNALRLVSDSAIRGVAYDHEGNLLIHAWSDGVNSVMYREPTDIFTESPKFSGLGFTASGGGIFSCAYVLKIDTKDYKLSSGTVWVSYLIDRDKPGSITINSMAAAADGSVCLGGNSAPGLIQTGNAFAGEPSGNYLAVLSRDLKSLRYCSALDAVGQTDVREETRYGIVSGTVNGKTLVMFLSGASEREGDRTAPMKNALQEKFAGGFADGHLLLLDLTAKK